MFSLATSDPTKESRHIIHSSPEQIESRRPKTDANNNNDNNDNDNNDNNNNDNDNNNNNNSGMHTALLLLKRSPKQKISNAIY